MNQVSALYLYIKTTLLLAVINIVCALCVARLVKSLSSLGLGRCIYMCANVVKGLVLGSMLLEHQWWSAVGCMVAASSHRLQCMLHYQAVIQYFVVVYCATDACQFVAGVPMSTSTKVHHGITTLFGLAMVLFPASILGHALGRALLWYGLCSCAAFAVNLYLGARLLPHKHSKTVACLRALVGLLYLAELAVNWPIHTGLIYTAFATVNPVVVMTYILCTAALMYDDLILLKHLLGQVAAKARAHFLED